MKKVTIILPVKNASEWIQETLDSIAGQSYSNWELIAVDDHSVDDSINKLLAFQHLHPDQCSILRNRSAGIIPALQMALETATGELITRIDADDIMSRNRLLQMVNALADQELSVVTGKVEYFSESGISEGYQRYQEWINRRIELDDHFHHIYRECVIASPNWLARKQDLTDQQIFEELVYPEDYHITLKWYKKQFRIIPLQETTLHWREHPKRTSRNSAHYQQKAFFDLKINEFITNEFQAGDQLGIVGDNSKTDLITSVLKENNVPYQIYVQGETSGIYTSIGKLNLNKSTKLLIAVYPDNKLQEIENYLGKRGFIIGKNAWYV